jgi:NADH:ubiquinone oxidoreductase subunit 6 (subunit J)
MTFELMLFYGLMAGALGSAGLALVSRSTTTAARALGVCALCVALVEALLLRAPVVGVALLVALAAGAAPLLMLVARRVGPVEAGSRAWSWRAVARWTAVAALVAVFVFVLVGTLARQYLWYGRALSLGSTFGDAASVGAAWVEHDAPLIVILPLFVLAAVLSASAALGARSGAPRARPEG